MQTLPYHEGAAIIIQNDDCERVNVLTMTQELYDRYKDNFYWIYSSNGGCYGLQEYFITD
jgi:hypothetical protein